MSKPRNIYKCHYYTCNIQNGGKVQKQKVLKQLTACAGQHYLSCFYERFALRKTSCLTLLGFSLFLLSEMICPVLENILSAGTEVATMLFIMSVKAS